MKQVTRTVETHTIYPAIVTVKDGTIEPLKLDPITVTNVSMNEEKAIKFVQKKYGKSSQYVILKIETRSDVYGLDFDVFMEQAKIINKESK